MKTTTNRCCCAPEVTTNCSCKLCLDDKCLPPNVFISVSGVTSTLPVGVYNPALIWNITHNTQTSFFNTTAPWYFRACRYWRNTHNYTSVPGGSFIDVTLTTDTSYEMHNGRGILLVDGTFRAVAGLEVLHTATLPAGVKMVIGMATIGESPRTSYTASVHYKLLDATPTAQVDCRQSRSGFTYEGATTVDSTKFDSSAATISVFT